MRNHSNENDFDLHENGREAGTHFHINGFTHRLVLKDRHRVTRKCPISKESEQKKNKNIYFLSLVAQEATRHIAAPPPPSPWTECKSIRGWCQHFCCPNNLPLPIYNVYVVV